MSSLKIKFLSSVAAMTLCTNLYANEISYTIKSQSLKEAIEVISKKSKIPYIVNGKLLENKTSKAVKDIKGTKNALNQILENSGLGADIEDGAIIIKEKKDVQGESSLDEVIIYGNLDKTQTATKLNLSNMETPQTVSIISRNQIDDYSLNDMGSVLDYVPGVTVERVETDRTYYTARGFDIVNFQFDGVGVPFSYGLSQGHEDMALYEQVEVVKGATGLITSLSNPSATINFIRKRPTDDMQGYVSSSIGRDDLYRVQADVSGTIIEDKLKGRFVIAKQDNDSYIDRYSSDTTTYYGILTADLTDDTRLSFGHSVNDNHNDGMSSGGLPLFYSDGTVTDYDVSTNTAQDWSYQDVVQTRTFVELEQYIGADWMAKAIYTHSVQDKEWESFYISGSPDPITGDGLTAQASHYEAKDTYDVVDLFLSGSFSAWGQDHELVAGVNRSDVKLTGFTIFSSEWNYDPVGSSWKNGTIPRPDFDTYDASVHSTDIDQELTSYYISTRLKATDKLSFLLGTRSIDIEQSGISYGTSQSAQVDELVPYIGFTYNLQDDTMLYASYNKVFSAQTWVDENLEPLGAVEGDSQEFGIKQKLNNGNSILTLAYFQSNQKNLGEWVAQDTATGLNTYRGVEYKSKGIEIELSGEVADGLNISAGFTSLRIEDEEGNKARRYIPTRLFKLATSYEIPNITNLRVGGGLSWQNEIYFNDTQIQGSYALLDFFAQYQLTKDISVAINVDNVTDKKYKESPKWGQANYGAQEVL
ncbi:TonB-dependent siderophore receptor [Halarcobacter anaerophilus]|uniref:TonB-dependent siderophore receptor n=1 Tax=Halarcobacter anaerophilus TaxID=877500 RepID=UPI000695BBE0|nr:TonB-dependent siderophore receptor [Halarcobacter anaerophilus]